MTTYRNRLPQTSSDLFLADGGLETTLVFDDGIDLPDFAAFLVLDRPDERPALDRYYDSFAEIAVRDRVGIALDTPTWRASSDWVARRGGGIDEVVDVNRAAVELLEAVRRRHETATTPVVISGAIGPRGDGYSPDTFMSAQEARNYHALQVRTFADSAADLVTAVTMTYADEAIGIASAAAAAGIPAVISFTVETDGTLPSGQSLADAIVAVDVATDGYPAYYMVNCAHPTHFTHVFGTGEEWERRIGGVRANASTMSHAELDEAEELDAGDPADLAARYVELRRLLPELRVLGGCCGTSHRHIDAISTEIAGAIRI
jgi:S-methylmethionine-dependent homocysteine/selenocysteine methylase